MKRVSKKTYAYGQPTDTEVRLKLEHDPLLQKWKDDPNLKIGNLTQPNQSEKSEYCVCGGHYSNENKYHHMKTKKHLDFIGKNKTTEKSITYNKNRRVHTDGFIDASSAIIVPPEDKCLYETCVRCGKEYPATPLYYPIENAGNTKTNIERESGKEVISNTPSSGCKECSKKVATERSKTDDECIRNLVKTYGEKYGCSLTKEWFRSQPFVCSISNIPLHLKKNDSDIWTASIQNNKPGEKHTPENCCLVALEFNVQQHEAIPDLLEAWKEAFQLMANEIMNPSNTEELVSKFKQWYVDKPKQAGVKVPSQITNPADPNGKKIANPEYTKLRNMTYFRAAFGIMLDNVRREDKKSKRNPNIEPCNLTAESMYQQLIKQDCKCYYTGIPLSLNRDTWNYFSCERLDNSKNHTVENCVFICRMMNGRAQFNRKKILTALLSQIHIPLSNECRLKAQDELNSYQ